MTFTSSVKPWYREPWPWYLMAGPFLVIVAASVTAWLAITTSDGLVTDDYYKKGLAVETTLAQNRVAVKLGLEVRATFTADGISATIKATAPGEKMTASDAVNLTLSHPTRAGLDQQVSLKREGDIYTGHIRLPASGHWLVLFEDPDQAWRVMGNVVLPAQGEVVIGGREVLANQPN